MIRNFLCLLLIVEILLPSSLISAETIKVASIFAFSGVAAPSNNAASTGVRLGVAEINRRGGILGRQIELIEIDNKSTPIGSKIAADQAVKAGVTAIIGASWSSHSMAVAGVAQAASIPMITPDSTHDDVTRIGDYIFRICYTDQFQGRVMAHFGARDLKAKTASVIFDASSSYSTGLARVFVEYFNQYNGQIDKVVSYKKQQDNFRDEMQILKEANSDILFVPGHDESAVILLEAAKLDIQSIPLGCDGWSTANFFARGGTKVALGYYSTHWAEGVETLRSQQFVQAYKEPGRVLSSEPLGYDSVMLLADAITRADSLDNQKLQRALAETEYYYGVTGNISLDRFGNPVKPAVIMHIDNGEARYMRTIEPWQLMTDWSHTQGAEQ